VGERSEVSVVKCFVVLRLETANVKTYL
jgi:hypothetical protein